MIQLEFGFETFWESFPYSFCSILAHWFLSEYSGRFRLKPELANRVY